MDEDNSRLSKLYLVLSQISIKNYNIKDAISNYEKYINCARKAYPENSPEEDKLIKSLETVLNGMKNVADELKKKNSGKGKDGVKKLFDELLNKHIGKYSEPLYSKQLNGNKNIDSDILLFDYMVKNGFIRPEMLNQEAQQTLKNVVNTANANQKTEVKEGEKEKEVKK